MIPDTVSYVDGDPAETAKTQKRGKMLEGVGHPVWKSGSNGEHTMEGVGHPEEKQIKYDG